MNCEVLEYLGILGCVVFKESKDGSMPADELVSANTARDIVYGYVYYFLEFLDDHLYYLDLVLIGEVQELLNQQSRCVTARVLAFLGLLLKLDS